MSVEISKIHPVRAEKLESGMDDFFNSFNHYSYGAICDFLFSCVAGIQPDADDPGYRHILLRPTVGGTLTHAEAWYESACGRISSEWHREEDGRVHYHFELPANTTAEISLPDGRKFEVENGGWVDRDRLEPKHFQKWVDYGEFSPYGR